MHVLYLHQYFATRRSKTATRSYEQACAIQQAGHQVTVVTSSAQLLPEEIPDGTSRIRVGTISGIECVVILLDYSQSMSYARRAFSFFAFMFWATWVVLRRPRPDLVFATSTPLTIGIPALIAHWVRRIPYVFEVRDLWPDVPFELGIVRSELLYQLLRRFERRVYRCADALVAVNTDIADRMKSRSRADQPVFVVPNACDTDLFQPSRDGSWFRSQYALEGAILAVHTGTMGLVNGLDAILDATKLLRDLPNFRVAIIGQGNQKDHLQARIRDESIDNVVVLDGLPKEKLADVLATADIGLMTVRPVPILELNCANKFFDYLASGLPVVLNYKGWQAKILHEQACGLSAAMGDVAAFADQIRQLALSNDRRTQMSQRARAVAETELSRGQVVQPILDYLTRHHPTRIADPRRRLRSFCHPL